MTLNENLLTGDDKYVFVVDYPTYDPTKGGAVKCNERRSEDFTARLKQAGQRAQMALQRMQPVYPRPGKLQAIPTL